MVWSGVLFHLDASNVCRHLQRLEPLVIKLFHIQKERKILEEEAQQWIVDATEIQTQRPKNYRKQRKYYSGKKKKHTLKVETIVEAKTMKILRVSKVFPGSVHDFKIRKTGEPFPKEVEVLADSGYQGLEKIHKKTLLPRKRTRGVLSSEDRAHNQKLSRSRIRVEHVIGRLKQWKILGSVYRNFQQKLSLRFNILAGIYNFILG